MALDSWSFCFRLPKFWITVYTTTTTTHIFCNSQSCFLCMGCSCPPLFTKHLTNNYFVVLGDTKRFVLYTPVWNQGLHVSNR